MAKITAKYQITLPKVIANKYHVHPGDEIEFVPEGDRIHVIFPSMKIPTLSLQERLNLFDESMRRQQERERTRPALPKGKERGWTREELYTRGRNH